MTNAGGQEQAGISASVEAHLRAYFAAHEQDLRAANLYDLVIQEVEMPLLKLAMDACAGNQLKASALLGLNRNTLRKKLRQLGLVERRATRARKRRP